ncbi:MAG: exopolyphosphatase [Acidobacteriota bacterium]
MRLLTRGDLDGLTCAVIITSNEKIEEIKLIHPQDITDSRVEIRKNDILANVPYHPNCAKWFDHHLQTDNNPKAPETFDGAYGHAPSAAGLAYKYYGGESKMPQFAELVRETDRLDSAELTRDDIENPTGTILLGYTIDSRSGFGAFEEYFNLLLDLLKSKPVEQILQHPDVKARCEQFLAENAKFREALRAHSRVDGNVVITDFRNADRIPRGNRFLVYTLFPDVNVSVRLHWGPERRFVVAAIGHSILNRTCQTNIGELVSCYGGGGHFGAGTTPLPPEKTDSALEAIVEELKRKVSVFV